MAFVRGVVDRFQQFGIAPRAADIFRRATAAGLDQARIELARLWIDETLDLDRVLPTVAEVVKVAQLLRADILEHLVEPRLAGIEEVTGPAGIGVWRAPADVACADLVEMAVGLAHSGLDRQVQPIEPDIEWHLDAAQNRRCDIVECDLDAGDRVGSHAASLRWSLAAAQFQGRS